jgi:CRP-like cAMP-binding protein
MLPLVDPVARAIYLRALPLFEGLESPVVATLARLMTEKTVLAGSVICEEGAAPTEVSIVVEGSVTESRGGVAWTREAPTSFGGYNLLVGEGDGPRAVAATDLRVLALEGRTFLDLLQENFDFMLQVWILLMRRVLELRAETGSLRPMRIHDHSGDPVEIEDRPLRGLVDRIRLLADASPWGQAYLDDVAELATVMVPVSLNAGDVLWLAGEGGDRCAVVATGTIRCTDHASGRYFLARRRDTIGSESIFGGDAYSFNATADEASTVLTIQKNIVFSFVEARPSLAMTVLRDIAAELIDLQTRQAGMAMEGGHTSSE